MIKRLLLRLPLLAFILTYNLFAQLTENFDTGLAGSYTTGNQVLNSGTWYTQDVFNEYAENSRSGRAARLNDDTSGASLTTPIINNGVREISFWYRELTNGGGTIEIQKSSDGVNYTTIATQAFAGTTYAQFTYMVNDASTGLTIRILSDDNAGHLIIDDFSTTAYSPSGNQPPQITNITQTPTSGNVTSSDAVSVSADVTDSDSNVANVELHWGTSTGNLSNTIVMSLSSSDTYLTDTDIPAQADGTTVYYEIEATDDDATPATETSDEENYLVDDSVEIISDDFQDCGNISFTPVSVSSNADWGCSSGYFQINAYGADVAAEDYLISEELDLDLYANETLTFESYNQYTDGGISGPEVELLYTNNYTGNPSTTSWSSLSATFASANSTTWTASGDIDLTGISGTSVRIAFRYTSSGTGGGDTSLWRIDNVELTGYLSENLPTQITSITQNPINGEVTSADAVSISANVTDSDGVASVVLSWGTTSGSLSNTITMTLDSGNTYTANTDIPAQADGTTVYYEIEAMDNAVEISTSSEQSYLVEDPFNLFITEVSDAADFSNEYIEIYNNNPTAVDMTGLNIVADQSTSWELGDDIGTATIPAKGFLIITRGGSQADFESEFGTLNTNTVFITGTSAMYFGTSTPRRWQLTDVAGEIIDDTQTTVAGEDDRTYQNIFLLDFVDDTNANANPGELDYLLYKDGVWTNSDAVSNSTSTKDVLLYDDFTVNTNISLNSLFVDHNVNVAIEAVLQANGNITNNGSITFVSNATTTGQLDEFYGTISGNDITAERFIPGDAVDGVRAFRFLTSAVTTSTSIHANWQEGVNNTTTNFSNNQNPDPGFGIHITGSTTGANGFDATPSGNPSLFGFDNQYTDANQAWYDVANTDVNTLTAGEPYRVYVRGNRGIDVTDNSSTPTTPAVIRATGDLATGNQSSTLGSTQDHFNFIGNPYQAIVDINSVLANSTNLNTNQYYVWDPNMNTQGAYATVDLSTGNPTPSASEANQFLQPGQAAFVTTLTNGASSVLFQESDKATSEAFTEVFRGANQATTSTINIDLQTQEAYANNGKLADGVLLKFSSNASNMIEADDATKLGNLDETLSIVNTNRYLSIESRALPQAGEEVPFYLNQYRHQAYVFRIHLNEVNGVTAYLVDDYLGTQTEMINNQENIYSFNVDESQPGSIDPERFSIAFAEENLGISNLTKNTFTIYPNPSNAGEFTLQLAQLNSNEVKLNIFNMLGKQVYKNQFPAEAPIRVRNTGLEAGIYLIQVEIDGKTSTQKLIVK